DDPAGFDIAAVEPVGREPLAINIDMKVLALQIEVAPCGGGLDTVYLGSVEGVGSSTQEPGAEDDCRVDPHFRPVRQGHRADTPWRRRFQQGAGIGSEME